MASFPESQYPLTKETIPNLSHRPPADYEPGHSQKGWDVASFRLDLMSLLGHSRRFDRTTVTSGLPRRSQPIDATLYLRGKDGVWDGTEIS